MASSPLWKDSSISMVPSSSSSAEPEPQISSPSSKPVQLKNTMRWPYASSMVASTAPKANSPSAVLGKAHVGRFDQIQVVAIPQIGLDDPPPADPPPARAAPPFPA